MTGGWGGGGERQEEEGRLQVDRGDTQSPVGKSHPLLA